MGIATIGLLPSLIGWREEGEALWPESFILSIQVDPNFGDALPKRAVLFCRIENLWNVVEGGQFEGNWKRQRTASETGQIKCVPEGDDAHVNKRDAKFVRDLPFLQISTARCSASAATLAVPHRCLTCNTPQLANMWWRVSLELDASKGAPVNLAEWLTVGGGLHAERLEGKAAVITGLVLSTLRPCSAPFLTFLPLASDSIPRAVVPKRQDLRPQIGKKSPDELRIEKESLEPQGSKNRGRKRRESR
ncbi:hypothetical protein B0H17DRAFT_1138503 [Mycena rosella]|uniref:Uncharacterized protein n=1 Tax=Mycena rosella TaxID=1033263 RepID=A0AAD7G9T7_MYCRO|nr:hypothetical protein B0H17DRAFT_1138503 [Mycena rosella]